jgi:uncharacterized protein (DUF2062 family)
MRQRPFVPAPHHSPARPPPFWTERLRKSLPEREGLMANPWLRPVANRLLDPKLWRIQHEAVARGVAIGTFWAFVIPMGQIVASTAHCVWWRGNIPVAAAITLITNPLTIGFWLWLAYQFGSWVLGAGPAVAALPALQASSAWAWLAAYGAPTVLGMGLFATLGAALGYGLVKVGWRVRVWAKLRHRARRS